MEDVSETSNHGRQLAPEAAHVSAPNIFEFVFDHNVLVDSINQATLNTRFSNLGYIHHLSSKRVQHQF